MKPVLQALLLADHVYEDKATGKKVIAGTFTKLQFAKKVAIPTVKDAQGREVRVLPAGVDAGSPTLYLSITEIVNKAEFVLRYVDLANNQALFETNLEITTESPLAIVEAAIPLPKLPTPHAGAFSIELLWNNEILGSHRIILEELKVDRNTDKGQEDERSE